MLVFCIAKLKFLDAVYWTKNSIIHYNFIAPFYSTAFCVFYRKKCEKRNMKIYFYINYSCSQHTVQHGGR